MRAKGPDVFHEPGGVTPPVMWSPRLLPQLPRHAGPQRFGSRQVLEADLTWVDLETLRSMLHAETPDPQSLQS